ncbi:MAG TPA: sodium:calcium antiporter [Thermoanaerobaculia bacterium]|nr:sodium:calcium antiporter [Thermoanaerobaculia bacterium]
MTILLIEFAVLSAVILFAGTKVSRYGDAIAEKSGLGRTWIGVVLLASVTSVPELATGISSVTVIGAPDIAAGDVLGSCMFNLLIIALMDFFGGRQAISTRAHPGQIVAAGFGILLLSLVALSLLGGSAIPSIGWVGLYSPLLLVLYVMAMRTVFLYERRRMALDPVDEPSLAGEETERLTLRQATARFSFFALFIIVAASFLPRVGVGIAEASGLGQTFIGNLLIAFTTSLPELVVSLAAVRIGAIDLAYGNLLGSNLFNVGILAIDDFLLDEGPILAMVSPSHGIAALVAIAMTAVAIVALTIRSERRFFLVAWESIVLVALYLTGAALLFAMRVPAVHGG